MDIINLLPEDKYNVVDDFLTFISIYDDQNRTKAYFDLLEAHKSQIKNKICVELGTGLGLLAEKMAQMGAKRVYAVEVNPLLFNLANRRLNKYENVTVILADAREFIPPEPVDTLVQEFYGQMLYDEELYILERLKWQPKLVLPDGGKLLAGLTKVELFDDPVVNLDVIKQLENVLVSGLFDEHGLELKFEISRFKYGSKFKKSVTYTLPDTEDNLLYFGLEITHDGQPVCRAGVCDNWSYVWTYKAGRRFNLRFVKGERAPEVKFRWL